jgi:hypothetical protein
VENHVAVRRRVSVSASEKSGRFGSTESVAAPKEDHPRAYLLPGESRRRLSRALVSLVTAVTNERRRRPAQRKAYRGS